ncbi:hypothetical protein [Peribacillus sp. NPDC056705]|uniref:hypothetical protein n=1 Tax=Peribacillus sp. NPDC056705 TaxID=3345918 RepID=UPI003748C2E4
MNERVISSLPGADHQQFIFKGRFRIEKQQHLDIKLRCFFTDIGTYMVTLLIPIILASSGPLIIGIVDGLSETLANFSLVVVWIV